ncbi:hypothetical protein EVAR_17021_1 [Eumeta japonica]|uniref:Secreted protein n=1 Tax=Eumeta variegata TaxID=151549 RepID=A0A4C1TVK0_EUMVA|nr:hypothetical protein EVAR_17021_1 [Eumeta japonica]
MLLIVVSSLLMLAVFRLNIDHVAPRSRTCSRVELSKTSRRRRLDGGESLCVSGSLRRRYERVALRGCRADTLLVALCATLAVRDFNACRCLRCCRAIILKTKCNVFERAIRERPSRARPRAAVNLDPSPRLVSSPVPGRSEHPNP